MVLQVVQRFFGPGRRWRGARRLRRRKPNFPFGGHFYKGQFIFFSLRTAMLPPPRIRKLEQKPVKVKTNCVARV